ALCAHAPARFQRRPQPQPPTEGSGRASLRREALAASVATPLRKRHSEPTAAEEALLRQITPVKLAKAEAKRPRHLARLASCPACISREDSRAGWRVSPREIFHSPPEIPGALPRSRCGLTLRPALPPRADEFAPSPPRSGFLRLFLLLLLLLRGPPDQLFLHPSARGPRAPKRGARL
ncbi:unnamed protein product, partial [Prorocentrum cordatum]